MSRQEDWKDDCKPLFFIVIATMLTELVVWSVDELREKWAERKEERKRIDEMVYQMMNQQEVGEENE